MKKNIYKIIFLFALVCFCASGFKLATYALHTQQTKNTQQDLEDMIDNTGLESTSSQSTSATATSTKTTAKSSSTTSKASEAKAMKKKYGKLYKANSDFVGWLKIDKMDISYPVLQTPDDPEHYLKVNFYGESDKSGALFADYRCNLDADDTSTNIIIYGHSMKDGTMFGELLNYKKKSYAKKHTKIEFDTMERSGTYKVFAVIQTTVSKNKSGEYEYYNFIDANSKKEFKKYLSEIKDQALYYNKNQAPTYGDEILTLSTCDYYASGARLAVLARRVK